MHKVPTKLFSSRTLNITRSLFKVVLFSIRVAARFNLKESTIVSIFTFTRETEYGNVACRRQSEKIPQQENRFSHFSRCTWKMMEKRKVGKFPVLHIWRAESEKERENVTNTDVNHAFPKCVFHFSHFHIFILRSTFSNDQHSAAMLFMLIWIQWRALIFISTEMKISGAAKM